MGLFLHIRLTCTTLISDGRGLGRYQGRVVVCAGLVPGDIADVCVEHPDNRLWEASLLALVTPSPYRVAPFCEHALDCGGCPWMIMGYETQALWKMHIVRDAFARIGSCEVIPLSPLVSPAPLLGQRTKMEYAFMHTEQGGMQLGLRRRASHEIVPVTACLQQSKLCMDILAVVRDVALQSGLPAWSTSEKEGFWRFVVLRETSQGECLLECIVGLSQGDMRNTRQQAERMMQALTLALRSCVDVLPAIVFSVRTSKSPVAYGERRLCSQGAITLTEQIGDLCLDMAHDAFFQVHRSATKLLYDTIKEQLCVCNTDKVHIWDIYCGVGSIALYMADRALSVTGMDNVQAAINQANRNAIAYAAQHECSVDGYSFLLGDAKQGLLALMREQKKGRVPKADVMIFDPPRSGLSSRIIDDILKIGVPRLVLVSCNPATLARDVRLLVGKYTIESVKMIDMFPHTPHVECVTTLQKNAL